MNKTTRILLAIGLILAVATPALAEFKISGFYRLMGYSAEIKSGSTFRESGGFDTVNASDEEPDSRQLIDQRLRLKVDNQLNDNVTVVWFGEVDTVWGENGKGGSNNGAGGKVGADGVNVETKNVYLDLKSGDTTGRLGIQTLADAYQGIVFFDDMAGALVTHKIGGTSLAAAYSKWDEDSDRSDWDDLDFYVADVKHKFSDNFTAGASVYFYDDNDSNGADTQDSEAFFYGLNGAAKFGNFSVDGFAIVQDGEVDNAIVDDYDTFAWAATAKGTMKLDNGDVGLRVIYFSEADDDTDDERWKTPQGRYDFVNENLMQMLTDKFVCNYGKERYAMEDAAEDGFGLWGFVASGNHKLPDNMYVNWGAGYFLAADDTANVRGVETEREGDTIGYELAVRVGKKVFEKVDISLNASFADYGDFYDEKSAGGDDPDSTYKSYLMVNVPF